MKFLGDAQLPRRFCVWLADGGHDALRTLDLPLGNRTPDETLIEYADLEGRVLVSKDDDFVQSRLVRGRPRLLWLIARQRRLSKAGVDDPCSHAAGGTCAWRKRIH